MDYNDLVEKYGPKLPPKNFDIVDRYNKKFLLLTPENYDDPKNIFNISEIEKFNLPYYINKGIDTFRTNEYEIDLKNYYLTKFIQIEYVEFYNSWPQIHDYSKPGPTYKLSVLGGAPTIEYEPIYFTLAVSTIAGSTPATMTGFTAYAIYVPPKSYTVAEFSALITAKLSIIPAVAVYNFIMTHENATGRLYLKTTNLNVKFFVGLLDINLTSSPSSFTSPLWFDPITNLPYPIQPQITNLDSTGSYFTGFQGLPLPTFSLDSPTININSRYFIPFTSINPLEGPDAFIFDMEEFLLLSIKPFNSTMDIANSSQYQNFMIPNSGGRGEMTQFNAQSNLQYSLRFDNKLVLNKLLIKWSFYNGQSCLFYNIAPIILLSYIPYNTPMSKIPFYLE